MLPSPRPVMSAAVTSTPGAYLDLWGTVGRARLCPPWAAMGEMAGTRVPALRKRALVRGIADRHDLLALVLHHDVVVRAERIVVLGRERLAVALDQALIGRLQLL